jgi:hypothetical protein
MSAHKTIPSSDSVAVEELLADPIDAFRGSYTRMETVDPADLPQLHLDGLKLRFNQLRDRIPTLKKLADRQGIDAMEDVEDVIPLLFDHAMYKSYPSQFLVEKRFDRLTSWLGRLTACDLSAVQADGCESIDAWLDALDAGSELRVAHTSGTSGTVSFLPWSKAEMIRCAEVLGLIFSQSFGDDTDWRQAPGMHVVFPYFRSGGALAFRMNDANEAVIAKGPERFHALFPGRASSDVLYLAARLRAATAKGQAHDIEIDSHLLERKAEYEQQLADMPGRVAEFITEQVANLGGERIWCFAICQMLFQMAEAGLRHGASDVFASDSVVVAAGGGKGWIPPEDWKDTIKQFFGVSELLEMYGMSEIALPCRLCEHGRFHIPPWIIPFVLDPDTSEPLPREGVRTGRAAYFDLLAETRWGGFVTGDEITLHWDHSCPCGRKTLYLDKQIERYSEKRGGSDKISCVATDEAHQEALEFLTRNEVN